MSLKKAIKYGKEHRKEYDGAKSVDPMYRNHRGCKWCEDNRTYQSRKQIQKTNKEIATFTRWQDPTIEELQQRIDKAIEYIKSDDGIKLFNSISSRQQWYNYLLSILEGKEVEDE